MSELDFDLARALTLLVPGAKWKLEGNSWAGLTWMDESEPPTETELREALAAHDAAMEERKVWATKAEFWEEFTEAEQLEIMGSTVAGIRLLDRQLLVWNGEVWSDDPRVQAGLSGLVAVGILTAERKAAILA